MHELLTSGSVGGRLRHWPVVPTFPRNKSISFFVFFYNRRLSPIPPRTAWEKCAFPVESVKTTVTEYVFRHALTLTTGAKYDETSSPTADG
jgi:hypothetical protein